MSITSDIPPDIINRMRGFDLAAALADDTRADTMRIVLDAGGASPEAAAGAMVMDFSRQPVDADSLAELVALARARDIPGRRDAMLAGEVVNESENCAATHTQLRDPENPEAWKNLDAMEAHCAALLGGAGDITDIVSIGIGGSALGPRLAVEALAPYRRRDKHHAAPAIHFAGNMDPADLGDCLARLDPAHTTFIVVSKTFRTAETLANLAAAKRWLGKTAAQKICAVTANRMEAAKHGFDDKKIIDMAQSIGGRFSVWSAAGLAVMAALGREGFAAMLAGAHAMDKHFATAPLEKNMPVIAALLRFANTALLGRRAQAVIPYAERLAALPHWLMQLEMESNGKPAKHNEGMPTAPVIFGEAGSTAQHSFFQMLHQGAGIIPVDFLAARKAVSLTPDDADPETGSRHRALLVNMLAQADALAMGNPADGFPGGRPSTIYAWDETDPHALGRLLALYEHATTTHAWLHGVNPFDQPGVELGKRLAAQYGIDGASDGGGDTSAPMPEPSRRFLAGLKGG